MEYNTHDCKLDDGIIVPDKVTEVKTYMYNKYIVEWNDHLKV